MALSVDWNNRIIFVPKDDLQIVQLSPTEIRQLDLNSFRLDCREIEAGEGMPFPIMVDHVPPKTVGSVTLARVVQVINGYTVTFEDGLYSVNLVGANTNLNVNTNRNQVSLNTSNSAGLSFSEEILDQSYNDGYVFIDPDRGLPGTSYPRGTPTDPVDNFEDAKIIADDRKFYKYALEGTLILDGSEDISDTDWKGNTTIQSKLYINGNDVSFCVFDRLDLNGDLSGRCTIMSSRIETVNNFIGTMDHCTLVDEISLGSSAGVVSLFIDCSDASASDSTPIINMSGTLCDVCVQGYHGELIIKNNTANNKIDIAVNAGEVTLESTCTNGTITVRGKAKLNDNSGAGCTVIDQATTTGALSIEEHEHLLSIPLSGGLSDVQNERLFIIPTGTLEQDERNRLFTLPTGTLTNTQDQTLTNIFNEVTVYDNYKANVSGVSTFDHTNDIVNANITSSGVSSIITSLMNNTVDTKTTEEILEILLAYTTGKIVKTGDSYTYYKQNNTTGSFTLHTTDTTRERS